MKRIFFSLGISFIITLSLFSNLIARPTYAWTSENEWSNARYYGKDMDEQKKSGYVSVAPSATNIGDVDTMRIICHIIPFWGEDMCTADQSIFSDMMQKSVLTNLGGAMAYMYEEKPANTYAFIRDAGESLGFIPKTTYAQGKNSTGYKGLLPILGVWKGFRNIAYGLLAISMIVIGFMIMFRRKIDPKTVMTVQNALPRIVVTLLLITFSYAIAGFMIDLMYVIMLVGIDILGKSGLNGVNVSDLQTNYLQKGFWALLSGVFQPVLSLNPISQVLSTDVVSGGFTKIISTAINGLAFTVLGGLIIQLLIALFYLFAFVKLFFVLLTSYVQVLFTIIISPLQLLMDVYPGSNQTSAWFKNLIANLLPFPITIFLLIIGQVVTQNVSGDPLWIPPLLPQSVGATAWLGKALLWLGIILSIPSVIGSVKEMLKTKGGIQMGGTGASIGGMLGGLGQIWQLGYQTSVIKSAWYHPSTPSTPLSRQTQALKDGPGGGGGGSKH